MSQAMVPRQHAVLPQSFRDEMVQQMARIQTLRALGGQGLEEIRTTHRFAIETYHKTLAAAAKRIEAVAVSGQLTPLKQAALAHLAQAYRYELLMLVEETGEDIIALLEDA